jgi:hypothetical protein
MEEVSIASYTYNLMQETYILKYAKIPRFELENHNRMRIAKLSKRAFMSPRGREAYKGLTPTIPSLPEF